MIWNYWPISQLQGELGPGLFDKIEAVLPIIDNDGEALFFHTDKESLTRLLAAFLPEDYFITKANLRKCLNFLPEGVFKDLAAELDLFVESQVDDGPQDAASEIIQSPQKFQEFLRYFQLPHKFYPVDREELADEFVISSPSPQSPVLIGSSYKTLKDYQANLYFRAIEALRAPMSRLVLQMPTGSGKTRTAIEIVSTCIQGEFSHGKVNVLWVANSSELCEQAIACFVDVMQHVAKKKVRVRRYWSDFARASVSNDAGVSASFTVASFQTLWSKIRTDRLNQEFHHIDLLVVDEAHISVAPTYAESIIKIAHQSQCRVLGLTATPGRVSPEETNELRAIFHGNILPLEDPSGRVPNTVSYLRSKGVLSDVDYDLLEITESRTLSTSELTRIEQTEEFSDGVLKKIGADELRNARIIERIISYLKSGSRGIVFAPSVESSKFITSMMSFLDFPVGHVDGSLSKSARSDLIQSFRDGDLRMLSNFGVLTTGFDDPTTDFVCIARPTKSPVLYSQMIGRGLRGPAVGGTERCTVLEVRDTYINMGLQEDLYRVFDDYWGIGA